MALSCRWRSRPQHHLRILVGRDQEPAQRLRERLGVAAAQILEHICKAASGAETQGRRRRERQTGTSCRKPIIEKSEQPFRLVCGLPTDVRQIGHFA
jgi:hypothetical protein